MRWTPGGRSRNLEDRRGMSAGGGRIGFGRGGLGLGGILLLFVLSIIFKQDFFALLGGQGGTVHAPGGSGAPVSDASEEPQVRFVSQVLDDAQDTWTRIFAEQGQRYPEAKLVLFRNAVDSACGFAQSAVGPFYCPGDNRVYIDLAFFDELKSRFGAPGDFAQAYVLAHEIGHHVQNVMGIERQVRNLQRQDSSAKNELSVRMELQADCFAGVWGHSTQQRNILEEGDVEEGLRAAAAVGDDRLQMQSQGRVVPESFTHGTSQQRMEWFRRGLSSGKISSCDTFAAR